MQCASNAKGRSVEESSASNDGEIPADNTKAMKAGKVVFIGFKSLRLSLPKSSCQSMNSQFSNSTSAPEPASSPSPCLSVSGSPPGYAGFLHRRAGRLNSQNRRRVKLRDRSKTALRASRCFRRSPAFRREMFPTHSGLRPTLSRGRSIPGMSWLCTTWLAPDKNAQLPRRERGRESRFGENRLAEIRRR